jgi:hypothetical protein
MDDGPLLVVCDGHRCRGLHALRRGEEGPWSVLREAVRRTRGAVLVRNPCLGPCHLGALAVLGWTRAEPGARTLALPAVDDPDRLEALAAWLPSPGVRPSVLDGAALPEDLAPVRRYPADARDRHPRRRPRP